MGKGNVWEGRNFEDMIEGRYLLGGGRIYVEVLGFGSC